MAKKIKVNIKAAAEIPSGDVNISYKGSRIAGLNESSTAVLETENTIVEDDIEIEYTKSGASPVTGTFDFSELEDIGLSNIPNPEDSKFTPGELIEISIRNRGVSSATLSVSVTSNSTTLSKSITVEGGAISSFYFWTPNADFTVTVS